MKLANVVFTLFLAAQVMAEGSLRSTTTRRDSCISRKEMVDRINSFKDAVPSISQVRWSVSDLFPLLPTTLSCSNNFFPCPLNAVLSIRSSIGPTEVERQVLSLRPDAVRHTSCRKPPCLVPMAIPRLLTLSQRSRRSPTPFEPQLAVPSATSLGPSV